MQLTHDFEAPLNMTDEVCDQSSPTIGSHASQYTTRKLNMTSDLVSLLFRPTSVASDVVDTLKELRIGVEPGAHCNRAEHLSCIPRSFIPDVVKSHREFKNRGAFSRIYPIPVHATFGRFHTRVGLKLMMFN